MDDLQLFQLLLNRRLDDGALPSRLQALARLSVQRRVPFFGVLGAALEHESAALRAAALRALDGAEGPLALEAIVRALDDEASEVSAAAVAALRSLGSAEPFRFVHALFHRRVEVRSAALEAGAADAAAPLALFLLADPALRDRVSARLDETGATALAAPPDAWPALLEFAARGLLARATARRLLSAMSLQTITGWLDRSRQRTVEEIAAVLAAARSPEGAGGAPALDTRDELDGLLDLFFDAEASPAATSPRIGEAFFGKLARAAREWDEPARDRALASLVAVAHRRGMPAGAMELALELSPGAIGWSWVARETRRAAVHVFYDRGGELPRLEDDEAHALLETDLAIHPGGGPDLYVVGGVLHLLEEAPYERVRAWLDDEEVLAAMAARIDDAAWFLSLRDESPAGRRELLHEIRCRSEPLLVALVARLALLLPVDRLFEAILDLDAARALLLLRGLADAGRDEVAGKRGSILGDRIAAAIGLAGLGPLLDTWLDGRPGEPHPVGAAALGALARDAETAPLVDAFLTLPLPTLRAALAALPFVSGFPFGKELALAHALASHDDDDLRAFAKARLPAETALPPPPPEGFRPVPERVAREVTTASDADSASAVAPLLAGGFSGVAALLLRRVAPRAPSAVVCAALLASHDRPEDADAAFARFGSDDPPFLSELDRLVCASFLHARGLPLLANAWLSRWEIHLFAFERGLEEAHGDVASGVRALLSLSSPALRDAVLGAVNGLVSVHSYRDRSRLAAVATDPLLSALLDGLSGPGGASAAHALVLLQRSGVVAERLAAALPRLLSLLPNLDDGVRERLEPLVASRGLAKAPPRPKAEPPPDEALLAEIRASSDVHRLAALASDQRVAIAHEATLRLVELGERGQLRLVHVLEAAPTAERVRPVLESVTLWQPGAALERARALAADPLRPPELRFRVALALLDGGETTALPLAVDALHAPMDLAWLRPEDWARLDARAGDPIALAVRVASSPQPHAYLRAVERLLEGDDREGERAEGLRAFLLAGSERMGALRRRAAAWLLAHGDALGFPLVLEGRLESASEMPPLLMGLPEAFVGATTEAFLFAGHRHAKEPVLLEHLDAPRVDLRGRDFAYELLLYTGASNKTRAEVARRVARASSRAWKLRRVAETFAWGVRTGRELTGRLFRVQMISGKGLGYTRLNEQRVFVTPLPILRGERHATEIVEALILHEFGHHMFHKGDGAEAAWKEAEKEGIHGLLNLVADEHLERNLRALDASFGDRLKRLAAYAFQHAGREIEVLDLVRMLQARTFDVLTSTPLGIARDAESVRVDHGALLASMERAGLAFPRFVRALRMGLGNRHDDPLVAEGLALFRESFRKGDMASLLAIAKKLRSIFGWQVELVETMGPHESLDGEEADRIIHGDGLGDGDIQGEVERVLNPKKGASGREGSGPGKPWVNVNPNEQFSPLTEVVKVPFDPAAHATYARQVRRQAEPMRAYLESLGLRMEPVRMRLQGRRFDASRTEALVVRRDPRVLLAREPHFKTDLFLGVVVDCSGSMGTGDLMERAKLFAALLSEASRGLRGVDVRLFGFTDWVIYDAGDATRCAAHGLRAGGGNNDAAALWYAASVARASRRKATILVMISDGLPTECSVAALRAVVQRLSVREGMCCAQVAVRPLEEVCFPHYVLLEDGDATVAVRKFGATIARLVGKTLAST